ncbi:hypothetical protein ASG07_11710 [Sphingomonas sp. Leaf343]|nr:hypothetical protein ASG07_11710 [Sphingomonas sp. Leaf343]
MALGGASLLLSPRSDEQLAAAMRAHDRSGVARIAGTVRPADAGTAILVARSLIEAGKAGDALTYLTPVAAAYPGDTTVAALLERAFVATGRDADRLAAVRARAANGGAADVRAWRALAQAAGDERAERAALERLGTLKIATGPEAERLAWLDEQAGAGEAARVRLAAQPVLSTDALQRLMRLSLADADAPTLEALLARLAARTSPPTRAAVIDDLAAKGRPAVALALAAGAAPGADAVALWPRRFALLRQTGDVAGARALLAAAVTKPAGVAPGELVRAAYALDWPEGVILAAEHHAIPRPDTALARDLAARVKTRPDLVARLDTVAGADWRRVDPWLAFHVAQASGDRGAALRAAAALPGPAADQAREQLLAGDPAALRALLIERAGRRPESAATVAERLLTLGFRDDAIATLRIAAKDAPIDAGTTRRLLYLMGPRPDAGSLAWIRRRADGGDAAMRLRWLAAYADRDRPVAALRTLEAHPLGDRTEMLLARIALAATTRDAAAANRAARVLLDGRTLTADQWRAAGAAWPAKGDPAIRLAFARKRLAIGGAGAGDRMDVAWTAWNGGDVATARAAVTAHLSVTPDDAAALMLMAAIEAKTGGETRALPWVRRAYAAGEGDTRERAAMLRRTGRSGEALAMIRRLRARDRGDRTLIAEEANLLIASGRPAAAQALFAR